MLLQGGIVHFGNLQPTDATSQERIDGNFIGSTQPSGGRTANASGGVGKAQTTKRLYIGWLEIQAAQRRPIQRPERHIKTLGPRERISNRQPHVGQRQLGDGGTVSESGHRMNDRLRMHDYFDLVIAHSE